jgi:hypothetical protein
MELSKETYKENLKSIMLPTLELIIDEVVDKSNDELYNRKWFTSNAHYFQLIARERIGYMLTHSKEVRESLDEYVFEIHHTAKEIQKYKSPPTNTGNQKEIVLEDGMYKRISRNR